MQLSDMILLYFYWIVNENFLLFSINVGLVARISIIGFWFINIGLCISVMFVLWAVLGSILKFEYSNESLGETQMWNLFQNLQRVSIILSLQLITLQQRKTN